FRSGAPGLKLRDGTGDPQEVCGPEWAPASRKRPERIRGLGARPLERHVQESTSLIVEVDAVFAPRLPRRHELELTPRQRVERMRDADPWPRRLRMRCSRRPSPMAR